MYTRWQQEIRESDALRSANWQLKSQMMQLKQEKNHCE